MKRKIGIALLLAATMAVAACGNSTKEQGTKTEIVELVESEAERAQTVTVVRGDMQISNSYDAKVGPKVVQLRFSDDGIFGEYKVGLGDTVKEGDILAVPDTEQIEEEIEAKERELSDLIANFEYQKATFEKQIENLELETANTTHEINKIRYREQIERIQLQYKQAQETYDMELAHCREQLGKLSDRNTGNVIKAPFDGVVVALHEVDEQGKEGVSIDTNLYYVAVADLSTLYARCEYISKSLINTAQSIVFFKDGVETPASYVPMTERIYREMTNNDEDVYSEFVLENPQGNIVSADYGKIKLVMKERKQVLILPETAVMIDSGKPYVYRDNNGSQEKVMIEIGERNELYVEIVKGLEEGDVVYVQ